MEKIISLFCRNYDANRLVRDEVVPGAEWVMENEGVATRKWDGTCSMVRAGKLYRRYDAKRGKTPPPDFEPSQEPDPVSGHWPGWVPVSESNPNDRWFRDAFQRAGNLPDGTYELIGPHINGNPENEPIEMLIPHGMHELVGCPRDFEGIKQYLSAGFIEGIVWHHPDGRMVKIKAKDFGISRRKD